MQVSRPPASRPALRALLIDISGTLHVGSAITPNAVEAFRRLQESGVPFRLCSNTSKESTRDVSARLQKLGFELRETSKTGGEGPREVWTSIGAVQRVMQDMDIHRPYLLLSDSARTELQLLPPENEKDSEDEDQTPFDAVIVGLCPARLDYAHLNTAFRILAREHPARSPRQPVLLAAHAGRVLEASTGGLALGPGPFVKALEHAVPGVKAHIVGKPSRAFFEAVIADVDAHGCFAARNPDAPTPPNSRVAIIGDDVEADLGGGAVELGLWRVLVRTGKYRPGDETRTSSPPDEVVDSFAAFVDSVLSGPGMIEKSLDMDSR
ncbi:Haloacid dehalogenase-like hydrolase domain-containing protein 2 [Mycena sanguinolenta]|uniref:Haloacid dehalogenase-like hydrolase domain-containing protein 2 n=1 Tax=Mycena sanguinolenta TaxID=230812 RepID=A0A8H7CV10_9AGAR|nr:Haloacid dehalogenase-like hydrolase domain-containing protein 2 [Mycena sanguinolenta]